ncbi:MAG: sulfatase [Verrucomicrobiales bacterium]|nr:sulfatase [Verrucomicrobiales bacterium]
MFTRLIIAILLLFQLVGYSAERPPNVILILVDDMGWMDLSCQGSDFYRTPNIDRIAAEGMRFTNGYAACAVCSPTRAAVQTGRYPHRLGVTDWIRSLFQRGNLGTPEKNPTEYVGAKNRRLLCPPNPYWMEHDEITIAEALKAKNYKSAYIGKWHLGDEDWYPEKQGYDENRGGCDYGQPPSYFDPYNNPKHKHKTIRAGIHKLPGRQPGEYLTHREADEAVTLIKKWKDEPFFLQVSHYAVHTPIQAIPEVAAKYEQQKGATQQNSKYAAMVESVDDSTGRILETIQKLGLDDNTLIIFTSDNGGLDRNNNPTDNAPLRSGKGYAYEGGIRVPFLVRWPGQIPEGKVSDTPVCSIDLFPTTLDVAGIPLRDDREIDGLSLLKHFKSGGTADLNREALFWHFPHYRHAPGPYSIIRKDNFKLIKFWEGPMELFDLDKDLSETKNLANSMPDKVQRLESTLMATLKAHGARLPRENPDFVAKKAKP